MHADRAGQPPEGGQAGDGRALQRDVGSDPTFDPSVPASWISEFDGHRAQHIDRLAADVDLHLRLALQGFQGKDYEDFRLELVRYGLDVMTGWLRNGKIFARMRERGWGLPAVDFNLLDHQAQDELVHETVAKALFHFHHDVLLQRKWDPSKGARLTTYFIGQCLMRFANIYRAWMNHEMSSRDLLPPDEAVEWSDPGTREVDDPAWLAATRHQLRRGLREAHDERLPAVLERLITGATHEEIANDLGVTAKTIERLLANNRDRIKKLGITA